MLEWKLYSVNRLEKYAKLSSRFPYINISNPLHCSNRFKSTFAPEVSNKGVKLLTPSPKPPTTYTATFHTTRLHSQALHYPYRLPAATLSRIWPFGNLPGSIYEGTVAASSDYLYPLHSLTHSPIDSLARISSRDTGIRTRSALI